jgi:hypothetical protein
MKWDFVLDDICTPGNGGVLPTFADIIYKFYQESVFFTSTMCGPWPAFTKEGAHAGPVEDWTLYLKEQLNRYLRDEGVF